MTKLKSFRQEFEMINFINTYEVEVLAIYFKPSMVTFMDDYATYNLVYKKANP